MQVKFSPVNWQCNVPVLFRRGQYLQSLLLQKENPLLFRGVPFVIPGVVGMLIAGVVGKLLSTELWSLPGCTTFVLGKKSVMELCLEHPAVAGVGGAAGRASLGGVT